jgi:hypothetical protein
MPDAVPVRGHPSPSGMLETYLINGFSTGRVEAPDLIALGFQPRVSAAKKASGFFRTRENRGFHTSWALALATRNRFMTLTIYEIAR